jgi:hypothetical protein
MTGTPTFKSWDSMRQRCTNPSDPSFQRYGAKGITVCDRWLHSFESFLQDMGERPAGTSLDRERNDEGYSPNNCRWATPTQQQRNRDCTTYVVFDGEKVPLLTLAERFGIKPAILRNRLKTGWDLDRALRTPKINRGPKPHQE